MFQSVPKISVITVCLNAEKILKRTIESVLSQTFSNLEYLVIDGGSTDNTKKLVEGFGNKINWFISEKDNGIYDAMNKGITKATGDLLIFLNAGDYYVSSNVISYTVNKMRLNEADVFFARFIWEDVSNQDIVLSDHASTEFDWDLKHSNFPHPATFYKRTVFSTIGKFDQHYKILADYEWNARALVKYRIPFQYISIIMALFSTDGMSNDLINSRQIEVERKQIARNYFQPEWLFKALYNRSYPSFLNKVFARAFSKRLNRIW